MTENTIIERLIDAVAGGIDIDAALLMEGYARIPNNKATENAPDSYYPTNRNAQQREQRARRSATTLSKFSPGDAVTFPHDGAIYHGTVLKLNRTTATVTITDIVGATRNRICAGMQVRVGAGILARGASQEGN